MHTCVKQFAVGICLIQASVIATSVTPNVLWTEWCGGDEGKLELPSICPKGTIREFQIRLQQVESADIASQLYQPTDLAARCEDGEQLGIPRAQNDAEFSVSNFDGFESVDMYTKTEAERTYISEIFGQGLHDGNDKPCSNKCPQQYVISGFQIKRGTLINAVRFQCTTKEKAILSNMQPIATPRLLAIGDCYNTASAAQAACCVSGCVFNSTTSNGVGTYYCNGIRGPIGNCGSNSSYNLNYANIATQWPLSLLITALLYSLYTARAR